MARIHIAWDRRPSQPAAEPIRRAIGGCLAELEQGDCEVHVLLTGDRTVRELNRRFRERDSTTDVLSFPDGDRLPTGRVLLGEIVVSVDAARRQARALGHDEVRELQELVLHGTLHLLGYDHDRDHGEMNTLELRLREELLS